MKRVLLFSFLIFFSCEKIDVPGPTIENQPKFEVSGLVGGKNINFQAGNNDYTMATSFDTDEYGIYTFKGHLKNQNCKASICPNSLKIEMRDISFSSSSSTKNIETIFNIGNKKFSYDNPNKDSLVVKIINQSKPLSDLGFEWGTINGELSFEKNPLFKFARNEPFVVVLNVSDNKGCSAGQSQTIAVDSLQRLSSVINLRSTGKERFLSVHSNGKPPFEYKWSSGETSREVKLKEADGIKASVTVTDANKSTCEALLNVKNISDNRYCVADFKYRVEQVQDVDVSQFGKVSIQYFDEKGVEFSSDHLIQSNFSSFRITDVEDFISNEYGNPTKIATIELNCELANGNKVIKIENAKIRFAFSYPG